MLPPMIWAAIFIHIFGKTLMKAIGSMLPPMIWAQILMQIIGKTWMEET